MIQRAPSPRYRSRVLAELKCTRGGELLYLLLALLALDDELLDSGLACIRVTSGCNGYVLFRWIPTRADGGEEKKKSKW